MLNHPQSLLVNPQWDIKLINFGIAGPAKYPTASGGIYSEELATATRWYRAPELLLSAPAATGVGACSMILDSGS
jgi:serine/threonine protein kinase